MSKTVKALVVAGGGGGGDGNDAGGGGAGGCIYNENVNILSGSNPITVGLGGVIGPIYSRGNNGGNSSIGAVVAYGGGGGGGRDQSQGADGGSGGGSSFSSGYPNGGKGVVGQGYDGSPTTVGGGGGGGAGGAAVDQNGGNGISYSITGVPVVYGYGGYSGNTIKTEYGSGGRGTSSPSNGINGIVIIRYTTSDFCTCTGGTKTTDGLDTIHTFTADDTFNLIFSSTEIVEDITYTSVKANGTVYSGGGATISQRGFVYNTSPNPIITNSKYIVSGTIGTFSASITNLTPNTTYYLRSYVIDEFGLISYGDQVTFSTLSVPNNTFAKDINAIEGDIYAVRAYIGGTTGTVKISLGSTGYNETFSAGAGYVTIQGIYSGLTGLSFEASITFNGYVDDISWVRIVGSTLVDWTLDSITNVLPINSQVIFRRIEDKDFNKFRIYRYLNVQFKDLDAYVTVMLKKESNEHLTESTKQFLVSNDSTTVLPFSNKKISMLAKNQAIRIGLSHNRLNETFTVCQFVIKGYDQPSNTFSSSKIKDIT